MIKKAASKGDLQKLDKLIDVAFKVVRKEANPRKERTKRDRIAYWDAKPGELIPVPPGKKWWETPIGSCHDEHSASLGLSCGHCGTKSPTGLLPIRIFQARSKTQPSAFKTKSISKPGIVYWCRICGFLADVFPAKSCGHLSHGGICFRCVMVPAPAQDKLSILISSLSPEEKQRAKHLLQ